MNGDDETQLKTFIVGYMLIVRLDVADLASVRFAYSPMQEAAFSLSTWIPTHGNAVYRPWLTSTAGDLGAVDWPFLLALRGIRGWLPDFLTPWPQSSRPTLEGELAMIRATPAEQVRGDLVGSHGPALPAPLADLIREPAMLTDRIADAFAVYWEVVMAPRWPRMTAVLERDITYRSHRIATGGAAALFEDLDDHLRWSDGILTLDEPLLDADVEVSGRGLPMMPSIFPRGVTALIDVNQAPVLTYPARGRGGLMTAPEQAADPLVALLGRTRATLLYALAEPASTTQLARAHELTPGGVNQHLAVLTSNGLLTKTRSGHSILYRRTALAERLVGGG